MSSLSEAKQDKGAKHSFWVGTKLINHATNATFQVDTLTYDDLTEGFTLLACVSAIKDLELKLSLPGRLVATCPITQISK